MREICQSCKKHVNRDFTGIVHKKIVNCLAYGCENYNTPKGRCGREEISRYCMEKFRDYLDSQGSK